MYIRHHYDTLHIPPQYNIFHRHTPLYASIYYIFVYVIMYYELCTMYSELCTMTYVLYTMNYDL